MKKPCLLLTRPLADSQSWASLLYEDGIDSVISPLLHIEKIPSPTINPDGYSGIIITSKHALTPDISTLGLPIFAVGEIASESIKAATVAEDVKALADELSKASFPKPLLYLSGEVTHVDLPRLLAKRGIEVEQRIVYRAVEMPLQADKLAVADAVAFFSGRSAEIFHRQTQAAQRATRDALCLSEQIAEYCRDKGWNSVQAAVRPTRQEFALLVRCHYRNYALANADNKGINSSMTQNEIPKQAVVNDKSARVEPVKPTATGDRPIDKEKPKRSGKLYGFIGLLMLTSAGLLVWQERQPGGLASDMQRLRPSKPAQIVSPPQADAMGENLARFNILKQELTELRHSHEALAQAFLETKKELESLRSATPAAAEPVSVQPPAGVAPAPIASPAQDTAALESQIAQLSSRITTLQQAYEAQAGLSAYRLKMIQAADDIQEKLDAGVSYTKEINQLQELEGNRNSLPRAAVYVLLENAEQGVPTLADLIEGFEEAAQLAVPASIDAQAKPDFGDRLRQKLGHLVTVRKVDVDSDDDSDEADIARAEAELRAGNVDMAITHLEQLSDKPKAVFAQWQRQANSYLNTRDAVAKVKTLSFEPAASAAPAPIPATVIPPQGQPSPSPVPASPAE